jgi:cell shape-determining protein MreC
MCKTKLKQKELEHENLKRFYESLREENRRLRESEGGEQKTGNRSVSTKILENIVRRLTRTVNVYRTVTNVRINCS